MVLLVVWMPATSLCLLERSGWLANDNCCSSSSQDSPNKRPADATLCCALASAAYKTNDHRPVAPVAATMMQPALVTLAEPVPPWGKSPSASLSLSPPELPTTWQFSFRAALPPRAPSFVS